MTIENEQVEGLMFLGYTAREAAFLCLVALHSGYSIRRQYCRFLGLTSGRPDDLLVRKILARKHAREHPTCGRTRLYHLCARPFYSAIGQPHNRHRRTRPAFAVKAKLMALDYVLTHLNHRFLATEEEKIDYFRRERGIPPAMLPVKRYRSRWTAAVTERYFVDKFPVYLCMKAIRSEAPEFNAGELIVKPVDQEGRRSRLLAVRQAAQFLLVAESTLYGWVWQRKIPFIKVGRRVRFDLLDLERFLDANRYRPG